MLKGSIWSSTLLSRCGGYQSSPPLPSPFSFPFPAPIPSPLLSPSQSPSPSPSSSPLLLSFPSPHQPPFLSYTHPLVSTSVPVPILHLFARLHPRSRYHSVPVRITVHVPVLTPEPVPVSVSTPDSDPAPPPRPSDLVRYSARVQTPGPANGAVGCRQAPLPVCTDDDACGMRWPAAKQKRTIAGDVLLPSSPPDAEIRWSLNLTCALPV